MQKISFEIINYCIEIINKKSLKYIKIVKISTFYSFLLYFGSNKSRVGEQERLFFLKTLKILLFKIF